MNAYPIWAVLYQDANGGNKSWRVIETAALSPLEAVRLSDVSDGWGIGCIVYPTGKTAELEGRVTSFGDEPYSTSGTWIKKDWAVRCES